MCGGGYLINRYSPENGFDNVSVYCKSLAYFICHVQNYLISTFDTEIINKCNIEKLNYTDLLEHLNTEKYEENAFLQSFK